MPLVADEQDGNRSHLYKMRLSLLLLSWETRLNAGFGLFSFQKLFNIFLLVF